MVPERSISALTWAVDGLEVVPMLGTTPMTLYAIPRIKPNNSKAPIYLAGCSGHSTHDLPLALFGRTVLQDFRRSRLAPRICYLRTPSNLTLTSG